MWRCKILEGTNFQEHAMSWANIKHADKKEEIIDPVIYQFKNVTEDVSPNVWDKGKCFFIKRCTWGSDRNIFRSEASDYN